MPRVAPPQALPNAFLTMLRGGALQRRGFNSQSVSATPLLGYQRQGREDLVEGGVHLASYRRTTRGRLFRVRYAVLAAVGGGAFLYGSLTQEPVPFSGRAQVLCVPGARYFDSILGEFAYDSVEGGVLPPTHPYAHRVVDLVNKLLSGLRHHEAAFPQLQEVASWEWCVCVVNDPEPNAFALPGGKIVVKTGLLESTTHDQLVLILAHEMSHVIARHGVEGMYGRLVQSALGCILQGFTNPALLEALYKHVYTLPNSRKAESEADFMGLCIAAAAGYSFTRSSLENPFGQFCGANRYGFERDASTIHPPDPPLVAGDPTVPLSQEEAELLRKRTGDHLVSFFSTHPSPEARVEALVAWSPLVYRLYSPHGYVEGGEATHCKYGKQYTDTYDVHYPTEVFDVLSQDETYRIYQRDATANRIAFVAAVLTAGVVLLCRGG